MFACCRPQNCEHCPRYLPGREAYNSTRFWRPGIMSILRLRAGTQKLWITSAVVATTFTRVSAGMWISLAVTASVPG
jgi:hypothetical protein